MLRKRKKRIKGMIKSILIIIIMVTITMVYFDNRLRPIVKNIAEYRARLVVTDIINNSVTKAIENQEYDYSKIVEVKTDSESNVTMLNTNMLAVNTLKTDVVSEIQKELSQYETDGISVPAGTLLDNEFLLGRGPSIQIKIQLAGNIVTDITNEFLDAGLNQTWHKVMLNVTADIYIVMIGNKASASIDTDFCISETVIVGKVPDAFTEIITDDTESAIEETKNFQAEVEK